MLLLFGHICFSEVLSVLVGADITLSSESPSLPRYENLSDLVEQESLPSLGYNTIPGEIFSLKSDKIDPALFFESCLQVAVLDMSSDSKSL